MIRPARSRSAAISGADAVGDQINFDKKSSNKKSFDDFNVFYVDLAQIVSRRREMARFLSSRPLSIVVFAEKTSTSWDKLPIQQDYRSPEEWKSYLSNVAAILQSKRPHLLASNTERFVSDSEVKGGHVYINSDGTGLQPPKGPALI